METIYKNINKYWAPKKHCGWGKYLKIKGMRSSYVMPQYADFLIAIKYKK